jgi:hypothetical protein
MTAKRRHGEQIMNKSKAKYDILFTVPDIAASAEAINRYSKILNSFCEKSETLEKELNFAIELVSDDDAFNKEIESFVIRYRETHDYIRNVIESKNDLVEKIRLIELRLDGSFNSQYEVFIKRLEGKHKLRLDELRANSFFQ